MTNASVDGGLLPWEFVRKLSVPIENILPDMAFIAKMYLLFARIMTKELGPASSVLIQMLRSEMDNASK